MPYTDEQIVLPEILFLVAELESMVRSLELEYLAMRAWTIPFHFHWGDGIIHKEYVGQDEPGIEVPLGNLLMIKVPLGSHNDPKRGLAHDCRLGDLVIPIYLIRRFLEDREVKVNSLWQPLREYLGQGFRPAIYAWWVDQIQGLIKKAISEEAEMSGLKSMPMHSHVTVAA